MFPATIADLLQLAMSVFQPHYTVPLFPRGFLGFSQSIVTVLQMQMQIRKRLNSAVCKPGGVSLLKFSIDYELICNISSVTERF